MRAGGFLGIVYIIFTAWNWFNARPSRMVSTEWQIWYKKKKHPCSIGIDRISRSRFPLFQSAFILQRLETFECNQNAHLNYKEFLTRWMRPIFPNHQSQKYTSKKKKEIRYKCRINTLNTKKNQLTSINVTRRPHLKMPLMERNLPRIWFSISLTFW